MSHLVIRFHASSPPNGVSRPHCDHAKNRRAAPRHQTHDPMTSEDDVGS